MRSAATQLIRYLPAPRDLRTDGDLLDGFLTLGTEDDFAELVRRHGPLVWGVCRRALPNPADAEDAFQATFLVLVRRGRKLTGYPTIGPWLFKVAAWTARNVRRRNARRFAKQSPLSEELPSRGTDSDLPLDIDAALLSLPEKFRSPIVLCHLLGYSRADAAVHLGCAEGTLSSWLARGLAKMRVKLCGFDPTKPLGVAAATVPTVLATSAVRAAVASRVAAASTAAVSSTVSQVVEGVIRMFWIKKVTAASAAVFAVFALGVGVGLTGRQVEGIASGQEKVVSLTAVNNPFIVSDVDKEIADLMKKIALAEEALTHANYGVEKVKKKIEVLKRLGDVPPARELDDLITLSRFLQTADNYAAEVKALKDRHEKLKAAKQEAEKPLTRLEVPKGNRWELSDIEIKLLVLKLKQQEIDQARSTMAMTAKLLEKEEKLLRTEHDALTARRAELGKQPAPPAKPGGRLELTLHGKQKQYEFSLKETDAAGEVVGTVTVSELVMLQKLLARTKADPTAPKALHVIASPDVSGNGYFLSGLKVCANAGFETVKFTGYVPMEFFPTELPANQKGEVKGYKRYDGVDISPEKLVKETKLNLTW